MASAKLSQNEKHFNSRNQQYDPETGKFVSHGLPDICRNCDVPLTNENWCASRRVNKNRICKPCTTILGREYRSRDPKRHNEYGYAWRRRNPVRAVEVARQHLRKLRRQIIEAYGSRCRCCGETTFEFLAIDHVNGGGTKHRKKMDHTSFYRWLKRNGYPQDDYRLLCHNCNSALGYYGACPHRKAAQ